MKLKKKQQELIKDLKESLNHSYWSDKIEHVFPKLFIKLKFGFEIGKWYKMSGRVNWLMCYKETIDGYDSGFGFHITDGLWKEKMKFNPNSYNWQPATEDEVFKALKKEAIKRGFKKGVTFCNMGLYDHLTEKQSHEITGIMKYNGDILDIQCKKWRNTIFYNGKWATIVDPKCSKCGK